MNKLCQCDKPGWCPRHQMEKNELQWQSCQGNGLSLDCGRKFWHAWEQGLCGATAPEDPQPDIEWECNQKILPPPKSGPVRLRGQWPDRCVVGRRVKKLLKEKYNVTSGFKCQCNQHAADMDNWGCDKCEEEIETIVEWMLGEVWTAPITRLTQVLTSGRGIGLVKDALNMREVLTKLVQQAIDEERERVASLGQTAV